MNQRQELISRNVDAHKDMILEAERWLWAHPQTGYTEWEAHEYLKERFEALGYALTCPGDIPGFITDVDTGRPGPCLCIMGELDALDIVNHPESVNGMTHSCGHHGQGAALLGIAAALKEPGALDGLSGKIRLMMVPAEEMIQLGFREELRKKGIIRYLGGKVEFMARGYFDGVDLSLMVHGATMDEDHDFACDIGNNGCVAKTFRFKGKSSHAGGAPHAGINAEYAAALSLQACNALRETFRDSDSVRYHPIMKGVNCAVNIIPDEMCMESYVRANNMTAIKRENKKINRALAGAALAMGAGVEISDRPGYSPEVHDVPFMQLVEKCCADLVGGERVAFQYHHRTTGSSDFGDITCVMPGIQYYSGGAVGTGHGIDYYVTDPYRFCVLSAKSQLFVAEALLENDAAAAKEITANYKPEYPSIAAYFEAVNELILDKDAVIYNEDGSITIDL